MRNTQRMRQNRRKSSSFVYFSATTFVFFLLSYCYSLQLYLFKKKISGTFKLFKKISHVAFLICFYFNSMYQKSSWYVNVNINDKLHIQPRSQAGLQSMSDWVSGRRKNILKLFIFDKMYYIVRPSQFPTENYLFCKELEDPSTQNSLNQERTRSSHAYICHNTLPSSSKMRSILPIKTSLFIRMRCLSKWLSTKTFYYHLKYYDLNGYKFEFRKANQ